MVASSIFNGYALSVLWGWFVVPTFGAPALGVVPSIGIAMVVSYLTHQVHGCDRKKEKDQSFVEAISYSIAFVFLKPSIALFFGWIVHLFM